MPSSSSEDHQVEPGSMLHLILEGKDLQHVAGWFATTDPFYIVSCSNFNSTGSVIWQTVYTSPKMINDLNPRWKESRIPLDLLCKQHLNRPIRIAIKASWEEDSKYMVMGCIETTVQDLLRISGDPTKMIQLQQIDEQQDGNNGRDGNSNTTNNKIGSLLIRHARVVPPRKETTTHSRSSSSRALLGHPESPPSSSSKDRDSKRKSTGYRSGSSRSLRKGTRTSSGSTRRSNRSTRSTTTSSAMPSVRDILLDQTSVFRLTLEGINLEDVGGWFSSTNPFYQVMRESTQQEKQDVSTTMTTDDDEWKIVHRSEHIQDTLHPIWKSAVLPLSLLCQGDIKTKLRISVHSREDASNSTPMGYFEITVLDLVRAVSDPTKEFALLQSSNDNGNHGTIRVIEAALPQELEGCAQELTCTSSGGDDESSPGLDESDSKQGSARRSTTDDIPPPPEIELQPPPPQQQQQQQSTTTRNDVPQSDSAAAAAAAASAEIQNLQKQLQEKDTLLEEAQEAMQFLESALNRGRKEQDALSALNSDLGEEMEQIKQQQDVLSTQNTNLLKELEQTKVKLDTATESLTRVKIEKDQQGRSYEDRLSAETSKIETLVAEKAVLEEGLMKSKAEGQVLVDKLDAANAQMTQYRDDLEQQKRAYSKLERETKETAEEAELQVFRMEHFVKVKDGVIGEMKRQTNDLEKEVSKLENQLHGAKREMLTTFDEFERRVLKTAKNPPMQKKPYAERLAEKSAMDRTTLETVLLDVESKLQAQEEKAVADIMRIQKLSANCRVQEDEIATLRKRVKAKTDAGTLADAQISQLQGECKRLSVENDALTKSLKATHADQTEICELSKKAMLLEEGLREKEAAVRENQKQLDSLEKEKAELQRSLDTENEARLEQEKRMTEQIERNASLLREAESKNKACVEKAATDGSKLVEMEGRLKSLTAKLAESDAEVVKLRERLVAQESSPRTPAKEKTQKAPELDVVMKTLNDELKVKSSLVEDLKQKVKSLKEEVLAAQTTINRLEAESRQQSAATISSNEPSATTATNLSKLKAERDALEVKCVQLEKKVKQLKVKESYLASLAQGGSPPAAKSDVENRKLSNPPMVAAFATPRAAKLKVIPTIAAMAKKKSSSTSDLAKLIGASPPKAEATRDLHGSPTSPSKAESSSGLSTVTPRTPAKAKVMLLSDASAEPKTRKKRSTSSPNLTKMMDKATAKSSKEETSQVHSGSGNHNTPSSQSLHVRSTLMKVSKEDASQDRGDNQNLSPSRSLHVRSTIQPKDAKTTSDLGSRSLHTRTSGSKSTRGRRSTVMNPASSPKPRSSSTSRLQYKESPPTEDGKLPRRRRNKSITRLKDMLKTDDGLDLAD